MEIPNPISPEPAPKFLRDAPVYYNVPRVKLTVKIYNLGRFYLDSEAALPPLLYDDSGRQWLPWENLPYDGRQDTIAAQVIIMWAMQIKRCDYERRVAACYVHYIPTLPTLKLCLRKHFFVTGQRIVRFQKVGRNISGSIIKNYRDILSEDS